MSKHINQHLKNDILFTSPPGGPIIELSIRGKRLALYTEDNETLWRFRQWKQMVSMVPYTRGKHLLAADLYFPLGAKEQLLKALSQDLKKAVVSQA